MVAEPLVQVVELALVGVIRPQLEDARGLVVGEGGDGQAGQDQRGGEEARIIEVHLPGGASGR